MLCLDTLKNSKKMVKLYFITQLLLLIVKVNQFSTIGKPIYIIMISFGVRKEKGSNTWRLQIQMVKYSEQ